MTKGVHEHMRLAFGECVFDSDRHMLVRSGQVMHLTPKAFRLLELILQHRSRALSKNEIVEDLWPDTFVCDGSVANLAAEIRMATGDDARNPRVLRTVQRFGYAFCGDATEVASEPALLTPASFRGSLRGEFALREGDWLIGRASDCSVYLPSTTVSRHHARLRVSADQVMVEDLGSKHGTYVRERRVVTPTPLSSGDVVRFGSVTLLYTVSAQLSSTGSFSPRRTSRPRTPTPSGLTAFGRSR